MKIFALVILLISTCFVSFCSSKKKQKNINWKETIGVIEGSSKTFDIYYDGDRKARFYMIIVGQVTGEKFMMRYNVDNPEVVQIDYWSPVFEVGEKTAFAIAKVEKIPWINFQEPKYVVNFSYVIDGHKIKKTQVLPPNYKSKYPNLSKSTCYKVEYDLKNPVRSILLLDTPITGRSVQE